MKKYTKHLLSTLISIISVYCCYGVNSGETQRIAVIPNPTHVKIKEESFRVTPNTIILTEKDNDEIKSIGHYLADKLKTATGYSLPMEETEQSTPTSCSILLTTRDVNKSLGEEGYTLVVSDTAVTIQAVHPTGLFWGVQTFRQLLPAEIENKTAVTKGEWIIPGTEITDKPRFSWRGLMLDCCRHFLSKDFIKRYIDLLAYYKINRLHWHLTEDQSWRIEIKKYPKLTEVGAWRTQEDGTVYGGFYTQEEIKEVVDYAKSRYVMIIPEIEMPGHCLAALAAYPEYSCTGGPFEVTSVWGIHHDVFCAGNDSTFTFLENILSEVVDLFPAPYIHIGGDEVPKDRWEKCKKCQARIQSQELKNEYELQSYFIRRIEKFFSSKERNLIGWDEILEGGLAPQAIVQSWRGLQGAITAAQTGHYAIVSPNSHAYFNASHFNTDLKKVYQFDPVPDTLTPEESEFILGGEACLWTEHITEETVDQHVFPRLMAMSEILWTSENRKSFYPFYKRVKNHYKRLDRMEVHYTFKTKHVNIVPEFDTAKGKLMITLNSWEKEKPIYYTLNGSAPATNSQLYTKPFYIDKTAHLLAGVFDNDTLYGETTEQQFIVHKATGKTVELTYPNSPQYTGGGSLALVDGIFGNIRSYACWQGFLKNDLEAEVDLEKTIPIHTISVRFLEHTGPYIFLPTRIEFAVSRDNKSYKQVASFTLEKPSHNRPPNIKELSSKFDTLNVRYIQIKAKNIGVCPEWHIGVGEPAWLFVDEIIVY